MKIKQTIKADLNNTASRNRIALTLRCGEQNIAMLLKRNQYNGRLTKMDALEAISKELRVDIDEILDKEAINDSPEKKKTGPKVMHA